TVDLIGITEAQRNIALNRLQDANLITINRAKGSGRLISLDAHPLVREYFASRVREQFPGAWRAAHRRLYEYLRDSAHKSDEPTLEELQPLYDAVGHACNSGLHYDAHELWFRRIIQGDKFYSSRQLGAIGSDLG